MSEQELLKLQKMTKAAIIEYFKHMDHSIEAKDNEISRITEKLVSLEKEKKALEEETERQKHLKSSVEEKDNEISRLHQEKEIAIESRISEINQQHKREIEKIQADFTVILSERDRRIKEINKLLYAHGDLLKSLESLTNTHLTLNEYIVSEIQK